MALVVKTEPVLGEVPLSAHALKEMGEKKAAEDGEQVRGTIRVMKDAVFF